MPPLLSVPSLLTMLLCQVSCCKGSLTTKFRFMASRRVAVCLTAPWNKQGSKTFPSIDKLTYPRVFAGAVVGERCHLALQLTKLTLECLQQGHSKEDLCKADSKVDGRAAGQDGCRRSWRLP